MTFHAQRHGLDQGRTATFACLLDRALGLAVDGEHVGAVDDDALESVACRSVCEMLDCVAEMGRGRIGPLVVVDHEHDREPAHAGEVHALVRVAARGSALAAPGDRHAALLPDPERESHPDRDREHGGQVADHRMEPEPGIADVDVAVAPLGGAVGASHVLREDAPRLDAAGDVDAHVALQRAADVVRPHRAADSDGGSLVAAARVERAGNLALLVEDVPALLDPRVVSMLRYMPNRSSRSRPTSCTS